MDSENRITPVNLFSIRHAPEGSENKTPIIFIHGALSSPHSWNKVKHDICNKTGRKGYNLCLRNHRLSGYSEEMSIYHMVEDVKNYMLNEDISKAIMIGHSIGGRVALAIALQNPEMVEKIIIEDMKLSIDDMEDKFAEAKTILETAIKTMNDFSTAIPENMAIKKVILPLIFNWSKKLMGKTCFDSFEPILPFSKDMTGKFVWDVNVDVIANFIGSIQKLNIPFEDETVFNGEALFIAAEYSVFEVLKQKELIKKHFPKSEFICAKDVHHCWHLEKSEEFSDCVINFLNR